MGRCIRVSEWSHVSRTLHRRQVGSSGSLEVLPVHLALCLYGNVERESFGEGTLTVRDVDIRRVWNLRNSLTCVPPRSQQRSRGPSHCHVNLGCLSLLSYSSRLPLHPLALSRYTSPASLPQEVLSIILSLSLSPVLCCSVCRVILYASVFAHAKAAPLLYVRQRRSTRVLT